MLLPSRGPPSSMFALLLLKILSSVLGGLLKRVTLSRGLVFQLCYCLYSVSIIAKFGHIEHNYIVIHCLKSVQIRSFSWSVFSYIRTEYGDLRSKSSYSVQIRENTDQKNLHIWTLFTQCIC